MKAIIAGMLCASSAWAFVDTLDTTNNFFSSFGGTAATENGNGTVTLTRNTPNVDAGIDWRNGALNLSLATENILTITPVTPENGGFWSLNLLFFDNGNFVNEFNWITDTQTTSVLSTNVAEFAGVGANEYFLRFRIQPFDQSNVGFTFAEIAAVPEVSPVPLVCGGLAILLLIVRRRI